MIVLVFEAIDNFDYFSFCIFIEKYIANDGLKTSPEGKDTCLSSSLD